MKFLIVQFALIALAFGDWKPRTKEEFFKDREECIKELQIPEATAEKIRKYQISDDPDAMCFVRCTGMKSGNWEDANGYNVDRVYETFVAADMEVSKDNLQKCFSAKIDGNNCARAALNMRCLWDNKYIIKKNKSK